MWDGRGGRDRGLLSQARVIVGVGQVLDIRPQKLGGASRFGPVIKLGRLEGDPSPFANRLKDGYLMVEYGRPLREIISC